MQNQNGQWYEDPAIARRITTFEFIDSNGQKNTLQYHYKPQFKIKNLKVEESKANNPRFGLNPIDDDVVLEYAAKLERGDTFPAIVITAKGDILGGNHRIAAAILQGHTTIGAFVIINGTQEARDQFTRTDNLSHGLPLTEDQRIAQAIDRHIKTGMPLLACTREFFPGREKTMYPKILEQNQINTVSNTLRDLGVKSAFDIPRSMQIELYRLCPESSGIKNDKVLRSAATMVTKHGLSLVDVKALMQKIEEARTESEQLTAIKDFERGLPDNDVKAAQRKAKESFKKHVSKLSELTISELFVASLMDVSKDEGREINAIIDECIKNLKDAKVTKRHA